MDVKNRTITINEEIKIVKLKVKVGTMIYDGSILLIYEPVNKDKDDGPKQKKLKSTEVGIIKKILAKQGDVVSPGSVIIELEKECNHPTVIKDLCAECGADLQKENEKEGIPVSQASISMIHMVPELKVNEELAQILGKADMDRLLKEKKLVLLVDLDQTLIHTTNDNIPNNIKDVYHFQLYGSRSPWYHTRLRPGTHNFLQGISKNYELHICTFGSRRYAHMIARFLDPDGKFFSHRILSRDECFDPNSKTANLKALFPCGENMVCVIDDREDVWDYASNLIHVKPYHFFQHTGDIHAPPSVAKCENDDNSHGFDFSQLTNGLQIPNIEDKNATEDGENKGMTENGEDKKTTEDTENMSITEDSENMSTTEDAEKSVTENFNVNNANDADESDKKTPEIQPIDDVCTDDDKVTSEALIQTNLSKILNPEDMNQEHKPETNESSINLVANKQIAEPKLDDKGFVIIEETDDYLLYLEEILKVIHSEFFNRFETLGQMPDLKKVIPETRAKVLKGVNVAFSGIVPNRMKLEDSQAYKIARSLGAKVTQNIEPDTTHLVALRAGTAKVHSAYKRKNLKLVTPEWLWTCAERWEKVDERLFTLKNAKLTIESRHPPAHCRSPEHPEPSPFTYLTPTKVNQSQVGYFLSTINPLMSLSSEDIETMEGEVEDIFKESDGEMDETFEAAEEEPEVSEKNNITLSRKRKFSEYYGSSSSDDLNGESDDEDDSRKKSDSDDETINAKFRRGLGLPSDLDIPNENTEEDEGTEEEQASDGEWNVMGAALEREFLESD